MKACSARRGHLVKNKVSCDPNPLDSKLVIEEYEIAGFTRLNGSKMVVDT